MGDCDRMKKYISDYLENNLDPTTRKQFEENLKLYPELSSLTKNVSILPSLLNKLTVYRCSDDFILHLRERIHSGSESTPAKGTIWKFSLALSFLVVIIITVFGVNSIFLKQDTSDNIHEPNNYQIMDSKPVPMPIKSTSSNTYFKDNASIESENIQRSVTDSSEVKSSVVDDKRPIQVKQINKTPIKNKN